MNLLRISRDITSWALLVAFMSTSFFPCAYQASAADSVASRTFSPASWTPPAPVLSRQFQEVAVPPVTPPVFKTQLPATPEARELREFRALSHPLLAKPGRELTTAHRAGVARTLERYVANAAESPSIRLAVLKEHLDEQPNSPFALSLNLEVSTVARTTGDFVLALESARNAWQEARTVTVEGHEETDEAYEAEDALANLAMLYASLGQRYALADLMGEIEGRASHPISSARLEQARSILANWVADPGLAADCGIQAYNILAAREGAPLLHKPTAEWRQAAADPDEEARELTILAERGLSAVQLAERVRLTGRNWRWIKRVDGQSIPTPSVVHLQFGGETGHYSALVEGTSENTYLMDRFLRFDAYVENSTLVRQASGYYMVPASKPLPEGFAVASPEELASVFGRTSCPEGSDDEGCNSPNGPCSGMAVATTTRFLPGLIVQDEPLSYRPAFGPAVNFRLEYRQVQLHGESILSETSNLGPLWSHGLTSYVKAPAVGSSKVRILSGDTYFEYTKSGSIFIARYKERPNMTELGNGYRITAADGSMQDYTQPNGPTPTRYYLTKITDPQGNFQTIAYDQYLRLSTITDATGKVTSFTYSGPGDRKIQSIVDPFGRKAMFAYDGYGRLVSITDVIGIVSSFTYDANASDRINSITTPYGTTQVAYEGTPAVNAYDVHWSVTLTDPEGFSSRTEYLYHDGNTPFTIGENAEPRPPGSIMVGGSPVSFLTTVPEADHFHVTLEWNKKQWYHFQADKAANPNVDAKDYAQYTLWLMRPGNLYTAGVPVATRSPGESAVWYNYEGQANGYSTGTSARPAKMARQVEDENGALTWVMTQQTYNSAGLPSVYTDELGRQTQINYVPNTADVSSVQALTTTPSTWTTLASFAYPTPNLHLPQTVTDVSGLVTTYTYNAKGQVTEIRTSKGANVETIRGTYSATGTGTPPAWPGTPGYLVKVERTDPANAAAWVTTDELTYDTAGRVRTHKDASGYQRTFDYDDFDRLTLATHPDASTEQFDYKWLDLAAIKDRAGRWSRTLYNPRRQPVMQIAPNGDATQLEWCLCGELQKLIDPLGRVTKWTWTIGGRNTEKVLPDGVTKTTYTYQPRSGRLATVAQPNDQASGNPTVTYSYQLDGRLKSENYTDPGTTDVTYTYEADKLGRLTNVVDGIGTHVFSYVPLTQGTAGAGSLEFVNGPLTNDRIQNVYDWQDRVGTANLIEDASTTNLRSESYTWDSLGRLKTVTNALGAYTYGYNTNLARLDNLTGPNTVTSSFTYKPNNDPGDSAQSLASITHLRGAVQQAKHIYGYDKAGRITNWEQQSIGLPAAKSAYTYNLKDELIQAEDRQLPANTLLDRETWGLDAAGNWLSHTRTVDNFTETRAFNSLNGVERIGGAGSIVVEGTVNEFATVTVNGQSTTLQADPTNGGYRFRRVVPVSDGPNSVSVKATDPQNETTVEDWLFNVLAENRTFAYDANGNTLSDEIRTMTWDAKNRLRTVTNGGTTWKWDYDYRDRRVREYQNGVVTKLFVWDDTEIVQERNAANTITRTQYLGGFSDGPTPTTGTKYQTLPDHLGNIREVLTETGTIAARYDYTPYQGPVKVGTSTVDPTLLTIGRYYHHAGSGLEMALYRACEPGLGRWLSRDPIEEEGGLNLYQYVENRPIDLLDPDGLQSRRGGVPASRLPTPQRPGLRAPYIRPSALMGPQTFARVCRALKHIDSGKPVPGGQGGRIFQNREAKLPAADRNGNPVTYREWDVNAKVPGQTRDAERIVTGSEGSVYHTCDHYQSFGYVPGRKW